MRALLAACLLAVAAAPVLADQTTGTVAAYDATKNVLTFTDRTVWLLPKDTQLPEGVKPGDALTIDYESNADNGWQKIVKIDRARTRG